MKKFALKAVGAAMIVASLSGCVGSNAVTAKLMQFNIEVVDNRYARAGVNFLLSPVYAITVAVDYVVINSLEFWTGKNPINGKPHIFDSKVDTMLDINDGLDPSLTDAPLDPVSFNRNIESSTMQQIDENTIQMNFVYTNGETSTLIGVRDGENVSYYMDGQLVSQTTIGQLEELAQTQA